MRVILSNKNTVIGNLQNNIKTIKTIRLYSLRTLLYAFLIILALIFFLPFYIMFVNASETNDVIAQELVLLPNSVFFDNTVRLLHSVHMFSGLKNSILTSMPTTLISAYLGGLAAFAFAKYKFKGNKFLFAVVIVSLIIPQQIATPGLYIVCDMLDILDTLLSLIIPGIANACIVFFLRYYINSAVTDSVMEAARIDGCGEFRIFNCIVLPMIIPALATISILAFIANWNSYLVPYAFLEKSSLYTLPIWVSLTKGLYGNDYGAIYTGILISLAPIILLFSLVSKILIEGLTSGVAKIYQSE